MPSPTQADIRSDITDLLGTDPSLSVAETNRMIQLAYDRLYDSWFWSRRFRDFVIPLVPQVVSDETTVVAVTTGLASVASIGTPFTPAMVGRAMQIGSEPLSFTVQTVVNASTLTLSDVWPHASDPAASWRIYQSVYPLPADCGSIQTVVGPDMALTEIDGGRVTLDAYDPERTSTGTPTDWCYAGASAAGVRAIEVWPVPTGTGLLRGQYLQEAPTLTDTTAILLPRPVITYAAASDCAGLLWSKTGDPAWQSHQQFFQGLLRDSEARYKPIELERTSPPQTIAGTGGGNRWAGTDYEVSHDLEAMDV